MDRREILLGGATALLAATSITGTATAAVPARRIVSVEVGDLSPEQAKAYIDSIRQPDDWMMRSKDYCKVIPDGELEIWKFNWKPLLLEGRAELVPLYKGDAVPKEKLTFVSLEEMTIKY